MEQWMRLTARQHGAIAGHQLASLGMSPGKFRHLVESEVIQPLYPGVFGLTGSPRTWRMRLMGAVLWGGPDAVASFEAAAALRELDGFAEGPIVISSPQPNRHRLKFKVYKIWVPEWQCTRIDGIPVTDAHRTLRDLLTVLKEDRTERVFDDFLRRGLVTVESLRRFLEKDHGSGKRGVAILRRLLDGRDPDYQPSASELNARLRQWLIDEGLTGFVEELDIYDSTGVFIGRVDFAFVAPGRAIVEGESRKHHTNLDDFERDLARRNRFTAEGWAMFHVTWRDIAERNPARIAELRKFLENPPA